MNRSLKRIAVALIVCLTAGAALAQFGGFRQMDPNPLPPQPLAEFHLARMHYESPGCAGRRGCGSRWWSIDYPDAEIHFLPALIRFTRLDVAYDSAHVNLKDPELFDYPFLFLQQPGQDPWMPTDIEAERLREYLLRGGFLVADDFHGQWEWQRFELAMQRVLPGRPIVDIAEDDLLLNIVFDLNQDTQIPGERHLMGFGGPARMDGPPHWRAIYDDDGRMLVAINHNIDMGDAWEHADDAHYPLEMTSLAYRFGVNYVIYAMTH